MARQARLVVPGYPHHLTQRGNRRQRTFFEKGDYLRYFKLMSEWFPKHGVDVLAHSLMPNHVHVVGVPEEPSSLAKAMSAVNQRYAATINRRKGWSGSVWQGRFFSCPFDWERLATVVHYVLMNPVRAKLSSSVLDWPYSSVRAVLFGEPDGLVDPARVIAALDGQPVELDADVAPLARSEIAKHTRSGFPLGAERFVSELEKRYGRVLRPRAKGPAQGDEKG